MKVKLVTEPFLESGADVLVVPVFEEEKIDFPDVVVKRFLADNPKFGKAYENQLIYYQDSKVLLVGLGKKDKFNFEIAQNWAGTAVKTLLSKVKSITLTLPGVDRLSSEQLVEAVVIGTELAIHDPSQRYKSEKEQVKLQVVEIATGKTSSDLSKALKRGQVIAKSINLARELGDMPANEMTPSCFLEVANKIAKDNGLKITIIDETEAKKLGMGAFAAVAQGSDESAYMLALEYSGKPGSKEKWGLVGKGITFDSGGISIKPDKGMHEMKYDMSGAGAVLAAIEAISKLKVKTNVVAVCALTENLPSGRAFKPGDIIKTYSGKTAEVLSTDAEGRLVLADALTFAQHDFKATRLIDLATLTGAMIVALGDVMSGVFSNNDEFADKLVKAGERVGEKYWRMPMVSDYDEMINSDIADMTNIGHGGSMPGAAGSITGAKFLERVIEEDRPWVHVDITGTAWDMKPKAYRGPGASGFGVKTLIELILQSR